METDKLIEAMARAIAEAHGQNPDDAAPIHMICTAENESLPWWIYYEEDATAALAALRETLEPVGWMLEWPNAETGAPMRAATISKPQAIVGEKLTPLYALPEIKP